LPYADPVQVYWPMLLTPQLSSGDIIGPVVHIPNAGWQPTPQKSLVVPQKPVFEQHLPVGQEPIPSPQLFPGREVSIADGDVAVAASGGRSAHTGCGVQVPNPGWQPAPQYSLVVPQ
jgi:hypothetical protein